MKHCHFDDGFNFKDWLDVIAWLGFFLIFFVITAILLV